MKWLVSLCLTGVVLVLCCSAQSNKTPTFDEVQAEISPLTDEQLIDCIRSEPKSCPLNYRDVGMMTAELGDRKHPDVLISAYKRADEDDRNQLVRALYQIDDPKVLAFMRSIAFEGLGRGMDDEDSYFPLDYLAKHCDGRALARLNRPVNFKRYTPMPCIYWAGTIRSFGDCNYRAAASNLIRSLDAACLNIGGRADEGLRKFFPDACRNTHSIEEEQRCYKMELKNHPPSP